MADTPLWTLINQGDGAPSTATAAPELPGPVTAYTQAGLLEVLARLLPEHYLEPLKSPGPGYEVLQAMAAAGARTSTAVARFAQSAFILSSQAGAKATGSVELFREAPHPEGLTVVVEAGTVVSSSRSGRRYLTTENASFGPADVGPFTVAVEAVATGYEFNEPGPLTRASGEVLPGEIDTVEMLVEDPEVGDVTIQVRHLASTAGGVDASMDLHGQDRGLPRVSGESNDAYRVRIRTLPDNISPNAVERTAQQFLSPLGAAFEFIETFELFYQTCWDGPATAPSGSAYSPTLFCYDDPRPTTPFQNRWLDINDMRGAFIVVVENLPPIADTSMVYGPEIEPLTLTSVNVGGGISLVGFVGFDGELLVTGLVSMSASSVGRYMTVVGSALGQNDGTFLITQFIDPTSVVIINPIASAPDPNNGFIGYDEQSRAVKEPDVTSLQSPLGARALCAYDVDASIEAFGYIQGAYDGLDRQRLAVYANLFTTLQDIKAAGTSAIIELRGQ